MISNADIKLIRSLKEKKFRAERGLFVIEGEKMLAEARASDFVIEQVYHIEEIGEKAMSRICSSSSAPPALAILRIPKVNSDTSLLTIDADSLSLALDGVRDPGNMGTILRVADWFGVKQIYASQDCVELYNPKVVAASMGSIFRVKCTYCSLPELCKLYKEQSLAVYGTFLDGDNIYEQNLASTGLLIMGNESNGISKQLEMEVTHRISIPSYNCSKAESLNVGVATAVSLSEFRRR